MSLNAYAYVRHYCRGIVADIDLHCPMETPVSGAIHPHFITGP